MKKINIVLRNNIKKWYGFICYIGIMFEIRFLNDKKVLKRTKYKIYHWLACYSAKKYVQVKKIVEKKAVSNIAKNDRIQFGFVVSHSGWKL